MRSSLLKGLVVVLVLAAVLVPAAAAKPHRPGLNLALVPLQKAQLGADAAGLTLTRSGSGPFQNGPSKAGYQLTYGSPYLCNSGLDYVETSVNEYKTVGAAKRGLRATENDALSGLAFIASFSQLNLTASGGPLKVSGISQSHWAMFETLSVANFGSVYFVGVDFRDGKYILESAAAAGSQDQAASYAVARAHILDKRLRLGLMGRLHAHPVSLPKTPKPGPPASGTDPATAVLQTSDLTGSQIQNSRYESVEAALSSYSVSFHPAGSFDTVAQSVTLMPSTNSAAFVAAFTGAIQLAFFGSGTVTPVDVSAAGDDAQAAIKSGASSLAVVTLHSGPMAEVLLATSSTTIDASAIQSLAQAAANRLNAAVGP